MTLLKVHLPYLNVVNLIPKELDMFMNDSYKLCVLFQMVGLPKLLILLDLDLKLHARFAALPLLLLLVGQQIIFGSCTVVDVLIRH